MRFSLTAPPGSIDDANTGIGYSPAGQTASENRDNDAFAFNGNRNANRDYTRNGLNQYTSVGPNPYVYDANGNLTSDALTTFTYDIENRLVAASGAKNIAIVYDPMGRLWEDQRRAVGQERLPLRRRQARHRI
ncbi:MAG: hypothetical protein ABIQ32_11535 [Sphingomicrobium sp.]